MELLRRYVSEPTLIQLRSLSQQVPFTFSLNHFVRVGEHENNAISEYSFSKWLTWNRHQRATFKRLLPQDLIERTFVANFTRYAAGTGFLDRIVQFRDRGQRVGRVTAIAMFDEQAIEVEDTLHRLNAGDAITFALHEVHAVPKTDQGGLWVVTCQM